MDILLKNIYCIKKKKHYPGEDNLPWMLKLLGKGCGGEDFHTISTYHPTSLISCKGKKNAFTVK